MRECSRHLGEDAHQFLRRIRGKATDRRHRKRFHAPNKPRQHAALLPLLKPWALWEAPRPMVKYRSQVFVDDRAVFSGGAPVVLRNRG